MYGAVGDRDHYLSTTGKMIDIMTDERIDRAISAVVPDLTPEGTPTPFP